MVCCGGVCIPDNAIWPLIAFALKFLWERFGGVIRRLLGRTDDPYPLEDECKEEEPVPEIKTQGEWDARLRSGRPLIVDFSASWCGPCKRVAPHFAKLAKQYAESADFAKVDIDVLSVAEVKIVPTFELYVDGAAVDRLTGSDPGKLAAFVEKHAKKDN